MPVNAQAYSLLTPSLDAICHTDGLSLYRGVVFGARHRIGRPQHPEHFNATLRLGLAHLARKSLSFCRKQANLETPLWLFIPRYNASFPRTLDRRAPLLTGAESKEPGAEADDNLLDERWTSPKR